MSGEFIQFDPDIAELLGDTARQETAQRPEIRAGDIEAEAEKFRNGLNQVFEQMWQNAREELAPDYFEFDIPLPRSVDQEIEFAGVGFLTELITFLALQKLGYDVATSRCSYLFPKTEEGNEEYTYFSISPTENLATSEAGIGGVHDDLHFRLDLFDIGRLHVSPVVRMRQKVLSEAIEGSLSVDVLWSGLNSASPAINDQLLGDDERLLQAAFMTNMLIKHLEQQEITPEELAAYDEMKELRHRPLNLEQMIKITEDTIRGMIAENAGVAPQAWKRPQT